MHATGKPETDLERRWQSLLARLERLRPQLRTQGHLVLKQRGRRKVWCLRYWEAGPEGRAVRRSLYVGSDPELVRRTRAFVDRCHEHAQLDEETLALARWAVKAGRRLRRVMTTGRRPHA